MGAVADYSETNGMMLKTEFTDRKYRVEPETNLSFLSRNILIVEDDLTTTSYLQAIINKFYSIPVKLRAFASAEIAAQHLFLTQLKYSVEPSLAIIDYYLAGGLDGLWLCKFIENNFPNVQTLLISSIPEEALKSKMNLLEVKPMYLQKPFDLKNLKNILNKNDWG